MRSLVILFCPPESALSGCVFWFNAWKFDEKFVPRHREQEFARLGAVLSGIQCPVTYIYGDQSIVVSRQLAHGIVKHLRHGHGPIAVPQSHHHVLLDQPLSLIAALRTLLYQRVGV